jgi:hypothetical protein
MHAGLGRSCRVKVRTAGVAPPARCRSWADARAKSAAAAGSDREGFCRYPFVSCPAGRKALSDRTAGLQ